MTTAKFTSAEWKELVNAPHWVHGALTAAERGSIFTRHSEAKALREFLSSYKTHSALVKEIIARQEEADEKLEGNLEDAEKELSRVGALLERKVDDAEGDDVRGFLMSAGEAVAEAAHEGFRKAGVAVSPKEKQTLAQIEIALRATEADKQRRHDAVVAAEAERKAKEAKAAEEAERRMQEEARKKREAEAKAEREREEARKRAEEAEAEAKAKEKARAEEEAAAKAQQEKVEAMRAASAKRTEEAKARAAREREEEAKKALEEDEARKAEEAKKAEAEAKKAAERTYKVKKGDTLSGIALKMYGDAGRWPDIFKANRDIIEKASLIRPGWVLRIPD